MKAECFPRKPFYVPYDSGARTPNSEKILDFWMSGIWNFGIWTFWNVGFGILENWIWNTAAYLIKVPLIKVRRLSAGWANLKNKVHARV